MVENSICAVVCLKSAKAALLRVHAVSQHLYVPSGEDAYVSLCLLVAAPKEENTYRDQKEEKYVTFKIGHYSHVDTFHLRIDNGDPDIDTAEAG